MPYTDMNGGKLSVEVGTLEREIVRDALNLFKDEMEKAGKKDKKLGAPNPTFKLRIAVIDGAEGWGGGLYQKFQEQAPLTPIESAGVEAQAAARRLRSENEALNEILAPLGFTLDTDVLATWTGEQRDAVRIWGLAWSMRGRDDADPSIFVPEHAPLHLLDALRDVALLEREAHEGAAAALCAALHDIDIEVPIAALVARTEAELQDARAWVEEAAPLVDAWEAAEEGTEARDAADQALNAVNAKMPEWIDAARTDEVEEDGADEVDEPAAVEA